MIKFIMTAGLIVISIVGFFLFTKPLYGEISKLNTEVASYEQALSSAKTLESERDKLIQKYNNISPENLTKLEKIVPNNVDNIRLILEIGKIALPYGMILKDVKYDSLSLKDDEIVNAGIETTPKDYGIWELQFSTAATYDNFISFLKDMQKNLRIIDIASIEFSSQVISGNTYNYVFKIKTYWLKN